MADAAGAHAKQPRCLSFKGALQTMAAFQDANPGTGGATEGEGVGAAAPPATSAACST